MENSKILVSRSSQTVPSRMWKSNVELSFLTSIPGCSPSHWISDRDLRLDTTSRLWYPNLVFQNSFLLFIVGPLFLHNCWSNLTTLFSPDETVITPRERRVKRILGKRSDLVGVDPILSSHLSSFYFGYSSLQTDSTCRFQKWVLTSSVFRHLSCVSFFDPLSPWNTR